jgi:hypothetical protein
MIQMQGVKEAHQHHPDDLDSAVAVLKNALSDFHYDELIKEEHCYVDVSLGLFEPEYAYQWCTDGHGQLLQTFNDCMTVAQSQSLLKSHDTAIDYSTGLIQLSGCYIPIPAHNDSDPVYFQAYITDKALI